MEKRLHLMAGLPRSGKTTAARKMGYPIVNPDSIRLAMHGKRFYAPAEPFVWATAYLMVEALFLAGHEDVIVDATNTTFLRRKEWFDRYESVTLHVIPTDSATCIERARAAGDTDIIPVIERMAVGWDRPEPESAESVAAEAHHG